MYAVLFCQQISRRIRKCDEVSARDHLNMTKDLNVYVDRDLQ